MVQPKKMNSFLEEAELRTYQFPEFQRPYVWGQNEVYDLVDTTVRGYSVGLILIWEGRSNELKYTQEDWVSPPANLSEQLRIKYILDGQQRIKTLSRTFGIDYLVKQGYSFEIKSNNVPRTLRKYPHFIFPSRKDFLNVTKNKRNRWISFDIFLDLAKINLQNEKWYKKFSPDSWVSLLDIIRMDWKKEDIKEFSILTEVKGPLNDLEFYIVECHMGKIEERNLKNKWYKALKIGDEGNENINETIKPIRFIYLNSLKYIEDIIRSFKLCIPSIRESEIQNINDYLQMELRRKLISNLKIKPEDIELLFQYAESVELAQLTHYFSRLNRAGVLLDVVDLLIAKLYDSGENTFSLRNMLQNAFTDINLKKFFNLKEDDDPSTKFKLLLQVASLYSKESLSDDAILDLTREDLTELEFQKLRHGPVPSTQPIIIKDSWNATIEFLDNELAINTISKLRYGRIFVILTALNIYIQKHIKTDRNINYNAFISEFNEVVKIWILRESISFNLATGSNKPPQRYKVFKSKIIPEIKEKIVKGEQVNKKELLDEIFIPSLSDENLYDKEFGKALMSLLLKGNGIYDFYDTNLSNKITRTSQVVEKSIELHHVFPKGLIDDSNLKKELDIGLNLTPLTKKTNEEIRNKHPFDYITSMIQRCNNESVFNEIMNSHCLPEKGWWEEIMEEHEYYSDPDKATKNKDLIQEQFKRFIEKRKEIIIAKLKDILYLD